MEFPNLIISKSEAPKAHQYCSILIFIISLSYSLFCCLYISISLTLHLCCFIYYIFYLFQHIIFIFILIYVWKSNILSRFSVSSAFCACALYIMESLYVACIYIHTTSIDHVFEKLFPYSRNKKKLFLGIVETNIGEKVLCDGAFKGNLMAVK